MFLRMEIGESQLMSGSPLDRRLRSLPHRMALDPARNLVLRERRKLPMQNTLKSPLSRTMSYDASGRLTLRPPWTTSLSGKSNTARDSSPFVQHNRVSRGKKTTEIPMRVIRSVSGEHPARSPPNDRHTRLGVCKRVPSPSPPAECLRSIAGRESYTVSSNRIHGFSSTTIQRLSVGILREMKFTGFRNPMPAVRLMQSLKANQRGVGRVDLVSKGVREIIIPKNVRSPPRRRCIKPRRAWVQGFWARMLTAGLFGRQIPDLTSLELLEAWETREESARQYTVLCFVLKSVMTILSKQ